MSVPFIKSMIAAGKCYVDIMDGGMNAAIEKRDAVLQRDAQLGLVIKLWERLDQLPVQDVDAVWIRDQVREILQAEVAELIDATGLGAEIQATLSARAPNGSEDDNASKV
jgi:hypothetical protein